MGCSVSRVTEEPRNEATEQAEANGRLPMTPAVQPPPDMQDTQQNSCEEGEPEPLPAAKPKLSMLVAVAAAGGGAKSWAKVMMANSATTTAAKLEEQAADLSASELGSIAEAERELCAAAIEAEEAHLAEVGEEDNTMVMSWDGGETFHYGDPTQPIPNSSHRHAAEARCYKAVVAKDKATAPSREERETQQARRGVYVWWLILFAQICDESWTTSDVVRLKIRPMTRRRRCRFIELAQMRDKTGLAAVFVSHTWGARFRELVAAIAYALPPDTLVWVDIFAVRQWPGNIADIDFRPVVQQTNALLLIARHLEQIAPSGPSGRAIDCTIPVFHGMENIPLSRTHVADISPSAIINANCQLDMRGGPDEAKSLQFVMRNTLRELPSDQLTTCAFFRIWCVVEIVAALLAEIPVLMLVGSERRLLDQTSTEPKTAAAGYLVQGAGSAVANGTYLRDGEYEGAPLYKKDQWYLLRYTLPSGNKFWYIADKDRLDVDAGDLYRVRSDEDEPPIGGWSKAFDGFFPAPTLSRLEEVRAADTEMEGEGKEVPDAQEEDLEECTPANRRRATKKRKNQGRRPIRSKVGLNFDVDELDLADSEEEGEEEEEEEGTPLGAFEPNSAMLDTLLECVDVGKAIASVEADRARELASVQKEVGIVRANCKARGAIIGAKHAMRVVPVLHAAATRQLAHLSRLADPAERAAALVASASVGLTGGLEVLLARGTDGEENGVADPFDESTLDAALVAAACGGHVSSLELLLAQEPPPQASAIKESFLRACGAGQCDTARRLLDAGAPLEARDRSRWTGLILGALCGANDLCEMLLERGAEINAADSNKWTAIIWASDRQQVSTVAFFIERGAIIQGAMHWARDPAIIEMLTARGGYKGDQTKLGIEDGVVFLLADKNRGRHVDER